MSAAAKSLIDRFGRIGARRRRASALSILLAAASLSAVGVAVASAGPDHTEALARAATAASAEAGGYEPLTPWHQPPVVLPSPASENYLERAEAGIEHTSAWKQGDWYCEYLKCPGEYPLATIWGAVGMFETIDGLELADPTGAHRARLEHIANASEHYWDAAVGGYAPYPGDRSASTEVWFDDNGWLGLAFYNAYVATQDQRYLSDAQRAFRFISDKGWDTAGGGGMWWNTDHPYHSGPAIASDTLLGTLLYNADHESWQLKDVMTYIEWANKDDVNDERRLYLEKPNEKQSVIDYVEAPLIYAQYLLCKDGQGTGEELCVHSGRLAATLEEQRVNKEGYRYNYGPQFDAIFMQWMMAYGQATGSTYWLDLAEVNAGAAAEHAYETGGLTLGSWWGGPWGNHETPPKMLRTDAATTSLFAWTDYYSKAAPAAQPEG